jgi:hypothetical protein
MLKRFIISIMILLASLTFLYGQFPTPTKTIDKPQNQTAASQEQAKIINDAAQNPMTTIPLPVTPSAQNTPTNQPQHHENKTPSGWWLITFNGLLVAIVFLQWLWMVRQGRWMRATQRAFMFIDTIDMVNVTGDPPSPIPGQIPPQVGPWIFRPTDGPISIMIIKNSGQTPAFDVIHSANICVQEYPPTSDLPAKDKSPVPFTTRTAIPPNGKTSKTIKIQQPLTDIEVANLIAGTHAIYVYGDIIYKDAFGKDRFTNFRLMYNGIFAIMGTTTVMTICEEGNEAN